MELADYDSHKGPEPLAAITGRVSVRAPVAAASTQYLKTAAKAAAKKTITRKRVVQ